MSVQFYDLEDGMDDDEYVGIGRRSIRLPRKRKVVTYMRQSSHEQRKKRRHSLEMQGDLRRIAIEEFGYTSDQVITIDKDLGISGTLNEDDRPGLAELLQLIRHGEIEAVFVVKPDRLYRDQTLVGPIDFALDCQKHDVFVIYLDYRGPTIIDFNNDGDFEDWIKMSQESAKELKNMQVRMGGARFYKAQSGKYAGGSIHWGWRYDPTTDAIVPYEPHRQTVINIMREAVECTSLRQALIRVKRNPACWFEPFHENDLLVTYGRHVAGRAHMPMNQPYIPKSIYQLRSILTCPLYVGIRTYGSGAGAQKKINTKQRKQKRGKVKSRLRIKPHFFGVFPENAILRSPEEQDLFWAVQERFNPIDLKHSLESKFKQERRNPQAKGPEPGHPWKGVKNAFARLVYCGLHGFDDNGEFNLVRTMRAWANDTWRCSRDYDLGQAKSICTGIRRRVLDRLLETHVRLRLSGGQNHLTDLIQLVERHKDEEDTKEVMRQQKLRNIQQAIDNYTAQLDDINMKTEVGKLLFRELQERIAPLLAEKQILEGRPTQDKRSLRHSLSANDLVTVREALKKISADWKMVDIEVRNTLLTLVLDNVVVCAVPGTRTLLVRFRWQDGYDDWCMGWYWGERNAEPWAEWEDEALQRLWPEEKSARKILAELKPGRKWRTVRPHARQLGLKSKIKRPDVAEVLLEHDKETVPTDESETLVYYFIGRAKQGEIPEVEQVQEVHEKDGQPWLGPMIENKISVCTWLSRFARLGVHTATSTPMQASTI